MATLLLSSCARVQIKDEQVCADIGSQGATCDNFLTSKPVDIPEPEWSDRRFGMLCMSADAFADFKREIEQLCSVSGECSYEVQQSIRAAAARVDALLAR